MISLRKQRKHTLLLTIVTAMVILFITTLQVVGVFQTVDNSAVVKRSPCLQDNESARFDIEKKGASGTSTISILTNNSTSSSFDILNIRSQFHPVELHNCGVYIGRMFNFDDQKSIALPGFKQGIWRYTYDGTGEEIVQTAKKRSSVRAGNNDVTIDYSLAFRVSPDERYLALRRGYRGREDYALVMKDLKTLEDHLVVSYHDIVERYPETSGHFGFLPGDWPTGQYFWTEIFEGAYAYFYLRVDVETGVWEVFRKPEGYLGVRGVLNEANGWVTLHPDVVWTGAVDLNELISEDWRREGKQSELYVFNLITGKQLFVDRTDTPLWWFTPKWTDVRTLEYVMPDGEIKTLEIE